VGVLFICLFVLLKEGKQTKKASLDQNPAVELGKGYRQPTSILGSEPAGCSARAAPASTQSPIEPGQDGAGGVCRAVVTPQACSFHCKEPARPLGSSRRVRRLCQPTAPCLFLFLKTTRHTGKINTKNPGMCVALSCKSCCSSPRALKTYGFFHRTNLAVLHLQSIFYSSIILKHRCTC